MSVAGYYIILHGCMWSTFILVVEALYKLELHRGRVTKETGQVEAQMCSKTASITSMSACPERLGMSGQELTWLKSACFVTIGVADRFSLLNHHISAKGWIYKGIVLQAWLCIYLAQGNYQVWKAKSTPSYNKNYMYFLIFTLMYSSRLLAVVLPPCWHLWSICHHN